jgi:hypothetical protein
MKSARPVSALHRLGGGIRCTEPPTIAFYRQNLSQATKAGGDADAHDEQAALLE